MILLAENKDSKYYYDMNSNAICRFVDGQEKDAMFNVSESMATELLQYPSYNSTFMGYLSALSRYLEILPEIEKLRLLA